MVASAKLFQLALVMINKHLLPAGAPVTEATREVLLLPSRIQVDLKRTESTVDSMRSTNVRAGIEPITVTVGFRDIIFFRSLAESYLKALVGLSLKPKPLSAGIEEEEKQVEKQEEKQEEKGEEKKAASEYAVDTYQVDASIDPLQISLVDNTEMITQQLFRVLFSSITCKLSATDLLDESGRGGLKESPEKLKASGRLAMEVMFYNNTVSAYEPIMESWGVDASLSQPGSDYGKDIAVKADRLMNFNMSYAGSCHH